MTINEETIKGKWLEIKGEIHKTWGKLTADEIEQTKGDLTSIAGLVMQRYGEENEKFQSKLSEIVISLKEKKEAVVITIKNEIKS